MINGIIGTTMISGIEVTTMISGIGIATMISGTFIWKIGGGPVRDTSVQDVVVVLHEVAGVDLVDLVGLSMR